MQKIALWPAQVEPWLKPQWRHEQRLPPAANSCTRLNAPMAPLRIIGIEAGSHLQLPAGRRELEVDLRVRGARGALNWYLDGNPLPEQTGQGFTLRLTKSGHYRLSVVDSAGNTDSIAFSFQLPTG